MTWTRKLGVSMSPTVSEVVSPDSAATVAPPVVITPISSTSALEGEAARFQCRVRGDGEEQEAKRSKTTYLSSFSNWNEPNF